MLTKKELPYEKNGQKYIEISIKIAEYNKRQ
jgi:hypothetical protein